jgi:hypothetical protein
MKKHLFLGALLLWCASIAFAQKKFTYLGFEFGPNYGLYKYTDTGGFLYTKNQYSAYFGVRLEQEITRNFSISVGVLQHNYGTNFRFKNDESFSTYTAMKNLQIPLRFSYTIPIKFGVPEVRFTPFIGAQYVMNKNFGKIDTIRERITPNFSNRYTALVKGTTQHYMLLEAGAGLDFMFQKGLTMSINGFYNHGLKEAANLDIVYRVNPADPNESQNAKVTTNGSYFGFSLGLRYPVSRFWQKLNPVKAKKTSETPK